MEFEVKVPAKCILSGEYAITEKGIAIVTPFPHYHLILKYTADDMKTMYTISGENNNTIQIILWYAVANALELLGKDPRTITGFFDIQCNIPPCSGLGFSAALCAAVVEWLMFSGFLTKDQRFDFAIKLEDIFHEQSSGVDIAGVMAKNMVSYSREAVTRIDLAWKPVLYISSSGEKSITKYCMARINQLRQTEPLRVEQTSEKMRAASFLVKEALEHNSPQQLNHLAHGLSLANECYYEWDLVSPKLDEHVKQLQPYALACKIIGAGFGGHVLSLWEQEPPEELALKLQRLEV